MQRQEANCTPSIVAPPPSSWCLIRLQRCNPALEHELPNGEHLRTGTVLHPGSLAPSPGPSLSRSSATLHDPRDGLGGLLPWLTASPVPQPFLLLSLLSFSPQISPPCPFSLSALLSQLLTFSVTGWKGLQDHPSGPQGNSDLSGTVAEQGLGREMQAQMGVLRKTLSPCILTSTVLLPAPAPRAFSVSLMSNRG